MSVEEAMGIAGNNDHPVTKKATETEATRSTATNQRR